MKFIGNYLIIIANSIEILACLSNFVKQFGNLNHSIGNILQNLLSAYLDRQ